MKNNSVVKNISLTPVNDIFHENTYTQNGETAGKIMEIPLTELYPFANHPFRVSDDEKMQETVESIECYGVLTPGVVRPRANGGYELIAGHRRKRACEIAGLETMPVIVRELDDDEAVILMVDSNLQRETLLYSERAFAYKMKCDAIKRQSGRPPKEKGSQIGNHFAGRKTYEIIGDESGESKNQIYRYIRLTELLPELLDMADEKKLAFSPAVELSYLMKEEQTILLDIMAKEEAVPSLSQAKRMKKHSQEGSLTEAVIDEIMCESREETMKVTFTGEKLKKYFPEFTTPQRMEEIIVKLLENWLKHKSVKPHNE